MINEIRAALAEATSLMDVNVLVGRQLSMQEGRGDIALRGLEVQLGSQDHHDSN